MKTILLAAAAGLALAGAASAQPMVGAPARPQLAPQPPELPPGPLPKDSPASPFTIFPIRGGIYMITGPGGNTTVSIGRDGILVVDPSTAQAAPGLVAQLGRLSEMPVRFVLDTDWDGDHAGGNRIVANSGENLIGGNRRPSAVYGAGGASIWAHQAVLDRFSAAGGDSETWPTDTYFVAQKDMFVNGEPVQMLHAPGHTDGGSLVMFRRSDVIAAGDIFTPDRYPIVDLEHGGSVDQLIDGLNMLLRLTVPEFNEEGGTFVVPGHGRLSDESDIAEYRDMVTIIRDRVKDMIRRKMTLAQIKAAKPTVDYDPEYGADAGQAFTETVYKSLTAKAATAKTAAKGERK